MHQITPTPGNTFFSEFLWFWASEDLTSQSVIPRNPPHVTCHLDYGHATLTSFPSMPRDTATEPPMRARPWVSRGGCQGWAAAYANRSGAERAQESFIHLFEMATSFAWSSSGTEPWGVRVTQEELRGSWIPCGSRCTSARSGEF